MLKLKGISKTYQTSGLSIEALRDINLDFRKSEFVAVLGPSGCGKTTLLNLIGGLDRYTSGDLVINGISTTKYKDVDWDIYRNNSIGFVFQSYNLIPHQTALSNVELAMTLAGISKSERRRRAVDALEKVGLSDQLNKKPGQMSGGQMQRVSIARALVNNPEIILADEPTGALDSETSLQIMEILKEISKDRLVVMVTHNPELAKEYSSRIIRLLDGKVTSDSNPCDLEAPVPEKPKKRRKISMSYFTAVSLSLNNLFTKKARTILTAFAGSIGIIGIALIMSASNGMQNYISNLERDTLSTYPLQIQSHTMDMSAMLALMMLPSDDLDDDRELDRVYSRNIMTGMMEQASRGIIQNDLASFKDYIENGAGRRIQNYVSSVRFGYGIEPQIFHPELGIAVNPSEVLQGLGLGGPMDAMDMGVIGAAGPAGMGGGNSLWTELIDAPELLGAQYEVVAGDWPSSFNEIVLIINSRNEISDFALYSLGLLNPEEMEQLLAQLFRGEEVLEPEARYFGYEELLGTTFKLLLQTDFFQRSDGGGWTDMREDEEFMREIIANGRDIRISGIIRPSPEAAAVSLTGTIGYTFALTEYIINSILETEIAREHLENPETDVFTGLPFANIPYEQAHMVSPELNAARLGIADFANPAMISIYPRDFASKEAITRLIEDYNIRHEAAGNDDLILHYTDIVGIMTSGIAQIIDIVSYVLIAFVSIALIVSSIMIAIITYISVLERTKEIGILRSIGAAKRDISRVFNAETMIIGFVAGVIGIGSTLLLVIPINQVIYGLSDIQNMAQLPLWGAIGLILLSVFLTIIAGFIPSKMAAKKDPVVALRTE